MAWLTQVETKNEKELKRKFAEELLRNPNDPYGAAYRLFGTDTIRALQVSQTWVIDPYVLEVQAELLKEFGEDEYLPSKAILARRVFDLADRPNTDVKDRLAAYKLYAEIRSFIAKPETNIQNIQNNTNLRVMVVKDFGNDGEWETKARKHQTKLIEHSRD